MNLALRKQLAIAEANPAGSRSLNPAQCCLAAAGFIAKGHEAVSASARIEATDDLDLVSLHQPCRLTVLGEPGTLTAPLWMILHVLHYEQESR